MRLAATLLSGKALVWWCKVIATDPDTLANMAWEDFLAQLEEVFKDIDKDIKLHHKI